MHVQSLSLLLLQIKETIYAAAQQEAVTAWEFLSYNKNPSRSCLAFVSHQDTICCEGLLRVGQGHTTIQLAL
jgi:hypothetical protein